MASCSYKKSSLPLLTSLVLWSITGCHQLSFVGERLPQEQHAGEGSEYFRESPAAKLSGQVPDGVADPANKIVYVRNDKNGIDALHLETGKVLWGTNEGALPLLVDKHLLALAPSEKGQVPFVLRDQKRPYKPWEDVKYRFVLLDTQQKGKRVWQSEPVAKYETEEGQASESRVWAWKEGDRLFFRYWSSAGYGGGMVPTEDMLIPRLHATVGEIQLNSGKFKILSELNGLARSPRGGMPRLEGADLEKESGPPPLGLTREDAQVYASGEKAFQTEVFRRGNRAITLSYQPNPEGGLLIWNAADLAGERKFTSRELFKGTMSFVVLPRSPLLFVKKDVSCWVFDLESGMQLGWCGVGYGGDWPAVVGDKWFFVADGEVVWERGMRLRRLVCCSLRSGRELWRHPLLPSPWSPPPP